MKSLLIFAITFSCFAASAGHESRGASELARAISKAKKEIIPNLIKTVNPKSQLLKEYAVAQKTYQENYNKFLTDLIALEIESTEESLVDTHSGYSTWLVIRGKKILYNEKDFINSDASQAAKKNSISLTSVTTEYLLHEIGHWYKLREDDAWTFSHGLIFAYQKSTLEIKPDLLLNQTAKEHRTGLKSVDVNKLCDEYKTAYSKIYFYVYCDLKDKRWKENVQHIQYSYEPRFLGYNYSSGSSWGWSTVWLYYRGIQVTSYSQSSYYNMSPVIEYVSVPHTVTITETHSVFDIQVYGLGKMSSLTWKLLKVSSQFYSKALPIFYETPQIALLNCREDLMDLQVNAKDRWKFDRAQCFFVENKTEQETNYYYEIKTLNPFILD